MTNRKDGPMEHGLIKAADVIRDLPALRPLSAVQMRLLESSEDIREVQP